MNKIVITTLFMQINMNNPFLPTSTNVVYWAKTYYALIAKYPSSVNLLILKPSLRHI